MASKQELRDVVISMLPWRPGLVTAGQQTSIPEDQLWKAKNVGPDLDGMLSKRPGITQWGQSLKTPDTGASGSTLTLFSDFLTGTTGYAATDNSSSVSIATSTSRGVLKATVGEGTSNENYLLSRNVAAIPTDAAEWSIRFMFRGVNLPAYTASGTVPNTFSVRAIGSTGSGKEFAIWSGGIYWKRASDSQYVLVADSVYAGNGAWNSIEIRCDDDSGNTEVYLNDDLLETLTSADLEDVTLTGTSAFQFRWEVEGQTGMGTQYSTFIATPMYNDTITTPFTTQTVVALTDYQTVTNSGSTIRSMLLAAGDYIYHDRQLEGVWRPLFAKQYSNVYFAPYRTTIVWSDNNGASSSKVYQWDGINDPTHLTDAPPVRFLAEHQTRLWGWGDVRNPRRLYYSADREPNEWFSPSPSNTEDEFSTLLDAGYVEISSRGKEVRAFVGDFFDSGIIAGEVGFWQLAGQGVFSYGLSGLKVGTGAVNAQSMTQVGADVWAIGPQGIVSFAASDKYGDLQVGFPSVPVQNLWNTDVSSADFINRTYITKSRMAHNVSQSLVYFGMPLIQDQTAQNIYAFNTTTQKFYGPWIVDCQVLEAVEVVSPVTEVTMVGGSSGQVGYFNPFTRADYGSTGYQMELELSAINGRSVDPKLIGVTKTFKQARLYILPRGDWNYTLTWWVDTNSQTYSTARNQLEQSNPRTYVLDSDMRLDLSPDGLLYSGESMVMAQVDLDVEGRDLYLNIKQSGTGQDLAIQGIEILGTAEGYEGD